MMIKAAQMNDPLPLRLGARVTLRPEEMITPPPPLDIDLTVRWVGDAFEDGVQLADMRHEAFRRADSPVLEEQLFGTSQATRDRYANDVLNARMRAALNGIMARPDMSTIYAVDPAARGDVSAASKAWVDRDGVYHAEPVDMGAIYISPAESERIGRELAAKSAQVHALKPLTVYTINGRSGYTEEQYEEWVQKGSPASCSCEACLQARHPLWALGGAENRQTAPMPMLAERMQALGEKIRLRLARESLEPR